MSTDGTHILDAALALGDEDRATLAYRLLQSLKPPVCLLWTIRPLWKNCTVGRRRSMPGRLPPMIGRLFRNVCARHWMRGILREAASLEGGGSGTPQGDNLV